MIHIAPKVIKATRTVLPTATPTISPMLTDWLLSVVVGVKKLVVLWTCVTDPTVPTIELAKEPSAIL